jgi:hypothetical protein
LCPAEEERYCRRWRRRRSSLMPSVRGIPRGMEALGRSAKVRGGLGYQKEVAGSPVAAEIKKNCGGFMEFRWAIPSAWGDLSEWKRGETGEEEVGSNGEMMRLPFRPREEWGKEWEQACDSRPVTAPGWRRLQQREPTYLRGKGVRGVTVRVWILLGLGPFSGLGWMASPRPFCLFIFSFFLFFSVFLVSFISFVF